MYTQGHKILLKKKKNQLCQILKVATQNSWNKFGIDKNMQISVILLTNHENPKTHRHDKTLRKRKGKTKPYQQTDKQAESTDNEARIQTHIPYAPILSPSRRNSISAPLSCSSQFPWEHWVIILSILYLNTLKAQFLKSGW